MPHPTLQPRGPEDLSHVAWSGTGLGLTRAASSLPPRWSLELLLVTHPTSIVQPTSGSNLYGLAWSGFSAPDQQGGSFLGLGRATFGLKKKKKYRFLKLRKQS